ncbi:hypothetical protein C8J56DRAFT_724866, partial [Mycena floridula]
VDRKSFWFLHDKIKDDSVFFSTSNRPQRPVKYQLATFLCRAGAESAVKAAGIISISEGSVYTYTNRVSKAFRRL